MAQVDVDAYTPAQMAVRVEKAGIVKGKRDSLSTFTLAVMAGVFIALGAVFFTFVVHDSSLSNGLTKLIGGLVFSLGLILVIITGSELFTGNNLIVMAYISRKITLGQLLNNWGFVFIGNFVGSLIVVFLIYLTSMWTAGQATVGVTALGIANVKVNLTFWDALSRGILCNILVCLAVYLCFSGRSVTDKILAILFPITAFGALGFEHSVANMYFITAGLVLKNNPEVLSAATEKLGALPDLSNLPFYGFLLDNLLPAGNVRIRPRGMYYQTNKAAVYMYADSVANEYVTLNKYPDSNNRRQQCRQTPEKIGSKVLKSLHISTNATSPFIS